MQQLKFKYQKLMIYNFKLYFQCLRRWHLVQWQIALKQLQSILSTEPSQISQMIEILLSQGIQSLKSNTAQKYVLNINLKDFSSPPSPGEVCGGNIFPCKLKTGLNLEFCFHIFEFYIIVLQASALEVQCLKMKYCYFQSEQMTIFA